MSQKQEEPVEESKIIVVDLAKDVFVVALANTAQRVVARQRLSRPKLKALLNSHPPALVLMEACGSAHDWGRRSMAAGHEVKLLPAQYVRPYRRGNKTDRADTDALLEAHRCDGIRPVPVRSVEQQQIQQLHRIREQWKRTRVQRINGLRGFLRELGHAIPSGAITAQRQAREILDAADFPSALKASFIVVLEAIKALEANIKALERQLAALTTQSCGAAACANIWHRTTDLNGHGGRGRLPTSLQVRPALLLLAGFDGQGILQQLRASAWQNH